MKIFSIICLLALLLVLPAKDVYLKHMHDLSDEEVVERWVENP